MKQKNTIKGSSNLVRFDQADGQAKEESGTIYTCGFNSAGENPNGWKLDLTLEKISNEYWDVGCASENGIPTLKHKIIVVAVIAIWLVVLTILCWFLMNHVPY